MSNAVNFNLGQLLGRAWELFVRHAAALVGAVVVAGLIMVVVNSLAWYIHKNLPSLVNLLLGGPFLLGFYGMTRAAVRGQQVRFGMIFDGFQNAAHAVLANLLVSLFVIAGSFCLIIGGVVVFSLYVTTFLFMADGQRDFWGAMESSRKMTMGNFVPWLLIGFVAFVLNCAGAALCGLGLLVSAPVSALLVTLAYEQQRSPLAPPVEAEKFS